MSHHTAIPMLVEPAQDENPAKRNESNSIEKVNINVERAQMLERRNKPLHHRSVSSPGGASSTDPLQLSSFSKSTVFSPLQLEPPKFLCRPPRSTTASRTDAPSCYEIAKWWIEECLYNHPLCAHTRAAYGSNKVLPTRVLDVGPRDGSREPFLFTPNGQQGAYLTLSHCWGKVANRHETTTVNIDEHAKCLSFNQLPATFQDAIRITRQLGYQYLWIDCYCIIQDSKADWEIESLKMASIYQGSVLTISALGAADSHAGIFAARRFRAYTNWMSSQTIIEREPISVYRDDLRKANLSKRGWTLQERVLSHALLHYGDNQLYWECNTTIGTDTAPYLGRVTQPFMKALHVDPRNYYRDLPDGHFAIWCDLVRIYTERKLTVPFDRLPAFMGMVSLWERQYSCRFLVGLWAEDLYRGLLWSRDELEGTTDNSLRPTNIRSRLAGPSWSWVACDFPVTYGWWHMDPLRRIEYPSDVEFLNATDTNIEVHGAVRSGTFSIHSSSLRHGQGTAYLGGSEVQCVMDFDGMKKGDCIGLNITTWVQTSYSPQTYFLLLQAVEEKNGEKNKEEEKKGEEKKKEGKASKDKPKQFPIYKRVGIAVGQQGIEHEVQLWDKRYIQII